MPRRMWGRLSAGPHHSSRGAHGAPLQTSFSVSRPGPSLVRPAAVLRLGRYLPLPRSKSGPPAGPARPSRAVTCSTRGADTPRRGSVPPGPGRRCPCSLCLPGGKDLRQEGHVRQLQHLHKVVKQGVRSGNRCGAGKRRSPARSPGSGRWSSRACSSLGVVGVVVIDLRPRGSCPCAQSGGPLPGRRPAPPPRARAGTRRAMAAAAAARALRTLCIPRHLEAHMGKVLAPDDDVKAAGKPLLPGQTGGVDVPLLQAEGDQRDGSQPGQGLHGVRRRPGRPPLRRCLRAPARRSGGRSAPRPPGP